MPSRTALSVLLKHISYKYVKEIQPILFDEIKDRPEFLVSRTINTEKLKDDKK